jgi:two-component system nitrate/nitrite response regulator NarL
MSSSSPTRILVVDDHTLFRESLRALLEEDEAYEVVAEVATVDDAVELCRGDAVFDIALIDYDLGPTAGAKNGVTVLRCLRERKEFIPALVIAGRIEPRDLLTVVKELQTGVFLKSDTAEELQLALRRTLQQEIWISSALALDLVAGTAAAEQRGPGDAAITIDARAREILALVVEGLTNKEIGSRLNLSESVVKATLQSLFEKVGVRTRAQLVRFAFESGNSLL